MQSIFPSLCYAIIILESILSASPVSFDKHSFFFKIWTNSLETCEDYQTKVLCDLFGVVIPQLYPLIMKKIDVSIIKLYELVLRM